MLASLLPKTNIHFRCWTRCSNIQAWFCVLCTLPCFTHTFKRESQRLWFPEGVLST